MSEERNEFAEIEGRLAGLLKETLDEIVVTFPGCNANPIIQKMEQAIAAVGLDGEAARMELQRVKKESDTFSKAYAHVDECLNKAKSERDNFLSQLTNMQTLFEKADKELDDAKTVLASRTDELEDSADKLSDIWIALDAVAHGHAEMTAWQAEKILRHQKAPGWKK